MRLHLDCQDPYDPSHAVGKFYFHQLSISNIFDGVILFFRLIYRAKTLQYLPKVLSSTGNRLC